MAFSGDFTLVLDKHSKHLNLVDVLAVGVDRMQRNFEPMGKQSRASTTEIRLANERAKLLIYKAFVEGELDVRKHLARRVPDLYFNPSGRGIRSKDDMEPLQRLHERIQGLRCDSSVL